MSRVGKKIIELPSQVTVEKGEGLVTVKGPRGTLEWPIDTNITLQQDGNTIQLLSEDTGRDGRAKHGLFRALLANCVQGVTDGFTKKLEIVGVGYRVQMEGKSLSLSLGYSHPVKVKPPEGISFEVEGTNKLSVMGMDRELVGRVSANIRGLRPPDAYKGKGVRFAGEKVTTKQGKSVKK